MSKKGKLILATAVFGTALFAASCGGGGGGGTTAGTGTGGGGGGGGGGTPSPTEQGRVLALLNMGSASAGAVNKVAICRLMSNNKAECGSDLNPNADVTLEYVHEFSNGNVVLKGSDDKLYFFDGSQVKKLTTYRTLGGISDINAPAGIDIPDLKASGTKVRVTPNFVILLTNSDKDLVVVTSSGKVIKDSHTSAMAVDAVCETVTKGPTTYKLNVDGTSYSTTTPTTLASAGGKYLVKVQEGTEYRIYLSDSKCSASGVLVDKLSSYDFHDAKMVKVGDDFYIAARTGESGSKGLRYYRVSGNTLNPLNTSITLGTPNKYYYALDGRGYLYAITSSEVEVYRTDGTRTHTATVSGVDGLLGLADRALAKTSSEVYEITATSYRNTGSTLHNVVNSCIQSSTVINGEGTNFVRCALSSQLYILTYNSGDGSYSRADTSFTTTISNVKWATNKVLVEDNSTPPNIYLCNTTVGATSISCSKTDLPTLYLADISPGKYLKVNGDDVLYRIGSAPYTLKVGNIFDPPSALPFTASSASGGNASFDLKRFAFSFEPAGAPCATQIAYLPSPAGPVKFYTLDKANTCVARILKVY